MSMRFAKVNDDQFSEVCEFYQKVIADMKANGLRQWDWEIYPTLHQLQKDLDSRLLYRADEDGKLVAVFALLSAADVEYAKLTWHYGVNPATVHRLAIASDCFGIEIITRILVYSKQEALNSGFDSLRLDVSSGDEQMLRILTHEMSRKVGRTTSDFSDNEFICFESPLSAQCPMLPIPMFPAYRYGEMTPWGGDALRTVFGKPIPDDRTGEALEISTIPSLESVTETGETLTSLVQKNRKAMMGDYAGEEFPLLLKLLSARESLSVQVHPDDAYAREHEGKFGKTEAWVILHAEEDAAILYGINEGITLDVLKEGLERGEDIEPMIHRVPVKAGDVFYMPSGMVHAIGGGILLYEIQQSSDITYRLWDYNRTNDEGRKRPLHIRQSLDVIDPALTGARATMPASGNNEIVTLLDVPAFKLSCALVNGKCELVPNPEGFRMLTALSSLMLSWKGDMMELSAGDSMLLPASCPRLTLTGVGRALISQ